MYVLTLSSFIFLVSLFAIFSFRHNLVANTDVTSGEKSESLVTAQSDLMDSVILDDLPPPDDTYTPDQRRYS